MKSFSLIAFILYSFFTITLPAFSLGIDEGAEFFLNYVDKANSYSQEITKMYAPNAVIKRTLIQNDGTKEVHLIKKDNYIKKLKLYSPFARILKYKNNFYELNFTQEGDKVRVNGFRQPTTATTKVLFPVSYLLGKDKNGKLKIFEDYTETTNKKVL